MPTGRTRRPLFQDRLCAVVATPRASEAVAQIKQALKYTKALALRLDWLRSDRERAQLIRLLKRRPFDGVDLLATCRRILGGGKLQGGAESELYWLMQAREAGCPGCDLEIGTPRELPGQAARAFPPPAKIFFSFPAFPRPAPVP